MISTEWLSILLQSKNFKQLSFVFGVIFLVISIFLVVDPKPFLKFGYFGVFLFNLFGPGTLLIPSLSQYMDVYLLAFASALGMLLNDSVSWIVGENSDVFIPRSKKVEMVEKTIHKYGILALFTWSLIPIPYDVVGFIAGYLGFPYKNFVLPTFFGKFIRFILMGMGLLILMRQ